MATIDFSSGYRDATKGATLKALQKRQDDQAAVTALAMKPREIGSMWQGAAQIGDVISGTIREGRLANQEAAGRARFAELLAGGLAPDEVGEAMGLDPETTMKFQERNWAQEDALRERGWSVDDALKRHQEALEIQHDSQSFTSGQTEDSQAHAIELAEKADKAAIVLADHNASIDEKKAAQLVIDNIEKEKQKVETDKETARTAAKTASDLATQNAAQGDEMAKIALAEKAGYITPEVAQQRRNALNLKSRMESQSAGSKSRDQKFAEEANTLEGGGMARIATNITQLEKAEAIMNEPGALEGIPVVGGALQSVSDAFGLGKSGAGTSLIPDKYQPMFNEKGMAARDAVHAAVQESLKTVLGSQFAAVESENLLERSFNPALSPKENLDRISKIKTQIMMLAKEKGKMVEYYRTHNNSLEGYGDGSGNIDINALLDTMRAMAGDTPAPAADAAAPAADAAAPAADPLAELGPPPPASAPIEAHQEYFRKKRALQGGGR